MTNIVRIQDPAKTNRGELVFDLDKATGVTFSKSNDPQMTHDNLSVEGVFTLVASSGVSLDATEIQKLVEDNGFVKLYESNGSFSYHRPLTKITPTYYYDNKGVFAVDGYDRFKEVNQAMIASAVSAYPQF